MVEGQGNWEPKCEKVVFCAYLRQQWIDLRQTKKKMISSTFYTHIVQYILLAEMLRNLIIFF